MSSGPSENYTADELAATLPFPPDPPALAALGTEPKRLPAGTELWHIYKRGGRFPARWNEPRYYGPLPGGRFDHQHALPRQQRRGIVYLALEVTTCVAGVFQRRQ